VSNTDPLYIGNEMAAFDRKDRAYHDKFTDEERKKFSTYLMLRYGASVEGSAELQEWYLRATNERVNVNFFDIGRHPKLQWLLCTSVSPDMGRQRHYWLGTKKKEGNNKASKFLAKLYPNMKSDEVELLAKIADVTELKKMAVGLGMDEKEIKKELL